MARPARPTQRRRKVTQPRLPDYLAEVSSNGSEVGVEPAPPVRRTSPAVASTRALPQRDFSYIKGDLVRVMIITAFLVLLLLALTFVIS